MTYSIAIHGGAGTIPRNSMSNERERSYRDALQAALHTGSSILEKGGSALDAVMHAVQSLEDCPLFNAGKGAVFTHDGKHELDAAIMCGRRFTAGAVASLQGIANPVLVARKVMDESQHVLLAGKGALDFAIEKGFRQEEPEYFYNELRYRQWQEALASDKVVMDHQGDEKKFGTVGAVARDREGNLAAATSTGGMTNKRYGRIGDTPLIGCGTYANNATCAVSATGHGEYFIRSVVAYDISCLMEYRGLSLQQAAELVVKDKLVKHGGEGGIIAIDREGLPVLVFNSEGMYRGSLTEGAAMSTGIYLDEA
jgi:beta-aspartyl-peptidase (threonine type)